MAASDLIQIVDENDKPIGEATRQEAQAKGLYHRIARIIVEDGNGHTLLQKRGPNVSVFPNCWDNAAAGHVDAGETYDIAARRELKEEIGIDAPLEKVTYYKKEMQLGDKILNRFITIYRAIIPLDTRFTVQEEELTEVKWVSVEELKSLVTNSPNIIADGLLDTVERFYNK